MTLHVRLGEVRVTTTYGMFYIATDADLFPHGVFIEGEGGAPSTFIPISQVLRIVYKAEEWIDGVGID